MVHLGLGSFFRAHQCWYTEHAPDGAHWGIAAFTGRGSKSLVDQLTQQQGLYTLVTRARDGDQFEVLALKVGTSKLEKTEAQGNFLAVAPKGDFL